MQIFALSVNDGLTIGDETTIEIMEIAEDYVRISIRSETVSPYYWEEMLSLDDLGREPELLLQ